MADKTNKEKVKNLNPKWELFCYLYARDGYCVGNATRAYMEAYELPKVRYDSAMRSGSRLLRSVEVRDRVRELLDEYLSHKVIDHELSKVILQDEDRHSKVAAIKEYNRIYHRDLPEKERVEFVHIYKWQDPLPRPTKPK